MHGHSFALGVVHDYTYVCVWRLVGIDNAVVMLDCLNDRIYGLPSVGALAPIDNVPNHSLEWENEGRRATSGSHPSRTKRMWLSYRRKVLASAPVTNIALPAFLAAAFLLTWACEIFNANHRFRIFLGLSVFAGAILMVWLDVHAYVPAAYGIPVRLGLMLVVIVGALRLVFKGFRQLAAGSAN